MIRKRLLHFDNMRVNGNVRLTRRRRRSSSGSSSSGGSSSSSSSRSSRAVGRLRRSCEMVVQYDEIATANVERAHGDASSPV